MIVETLVGAVIGGVGGALLSKRRRSERETPFVSPPNIPEAQPPAETQMSFQNDDSFGCPLSHRSYYGVFDWGYDASVGDYNPTWLLLSRLKGHRLTEKSYPVMDTYYKMTYGGIFPLGVWANGSNCDGSFVFYQVAAGQQDVAQR